jgi:hypothetical protein
VCSTCTHTAAFTSPCALDPCAAARGSTQGLVCLSHPHHGPVRWACVHWSSTLTAVQELYRGCVPCGTRTAVRPVRPRPGPSCARACPRLVSTACVRETVPPCCGALLLDRSRAARRPPCAHVACRACYPRACFPCFVRVVCEPQLVRAHSCALGEHPRGWQGMAGGTVDALRLTVCQDGQLPEHGFSNENAVRPESLFWALPRASAERYLRAGTAVPASSVAAG